MTKGLRVGHGGARKHARKKARKHARTLETKKGTKACRHPPKIKA